jgi:heme-degrading monooxygenase HmoA
MYARMVSGQFKPEQREFLTNTLEKDVIPLLKKQHGFRDEVSFLAADKKELNAISFWDSKADLEKYDREVYPEIRDKMAKAFLKQPQTHEFEVSNSTWYKIHAA